MGGVRGAVPRPKARFCVNGHDTESVGRTKGGYCKECSRGWRREYDAKRRPTRVVHSPDQALRERRSSYAYWDMLNNDGKVAARRLRLLSVPDSAGAAWSARWNVTVAAGMRAANRLWNADRVSVDVADRWCVTLGTHLAIVYPEIYYEPRITREETALL